MEYLGGSKVRNGQIKKVRKRIRFVYDKLRKGRIEFTEDTNLYGPLKVCKEKTRAWVKPVFEPYTINICSRFFDKDFNSTARGGVLVHEAVHLRFLFSNPTHFGTENEAEALNLAKSKPKKARRNPYNYQFLVYQYEGNSVTCVNGKPAAMIIRDPRCDLR